MPEYYVDGHRAGCPAQTLLIHAADTDAAITRASELGVTPKGARVSGFRQTLPSFKLFVVSLSLILMPLALIEAFGARAQGRPANMLGIVLATMVCALSQAIYQYLSHCQSQIQTMRLEIDSLREQLNANNLSSK
jgi:hypothetical protein